ncbi:D-alanine--D-alanine ligase family protein [Microbacterium sp. CPCC 204701]|uniref:D-alanine--D-alanine ligase family protein n=1 Tax=Microbacterium sp. CPCC 204701 TaxID=2493084 RepID=UPI000FD7B5E5|nr:ATP-grasp domain-containing protein [Microbacterium sp. CPCC 204701]
MTRRVVVVSGGASAEHEVSVASGRDVSAALAGIAGHSVLEVHVDRDGLWHVGSPAAPALLFGEVLDEMPQDCVVFPALHGGWGEGGGLQRELERRGIPFVGSGSDASARALSKLECLRLCAAAGVGVIPTWSVSRTRYAADPDLVSGMVRRSFDGDLVVKPDTGGSSIGVRMVGHGESLREAFAEAFAHSGVALVQPRVTGEEVSVGVWTDGGSAQATGASRLHYPAGADAAGFTYAHKYEGGGAVLEIPATFPEHVLVALRDAALRCFDALGSRGLARIDFFVDAQGRILLNEVNTIPGLRRESHFPRLVAAAGTPYERLVALLVEDAVTTASREREARRRVARSAAATTGAA